MTEVANLSLENEMDLVLAHKKSMKVAEKLGLTVSTQTTFATAVSEVARTVIEYTDNGHLTIGLEQNKMRYALKACVTFTSEDNLNSTHEGFFYAKKLMPEFDLTKTAGKSLIEMKIGLPRSLKLDPARIAQLKNFITGEQPLNPYDEIKRRNSHLHKLTGEQEEEIRQSKLIDEKKTEFISIASHELKTPMTVLKAYTQMAKSHKGALSEHLSGLLDKIDLQATKLNVLMQQLLDFSKIENGSLQYNMQQIRLNDFITDQVSVMKHIMPRHIVEVALGDDAEILVDQLRMEQVFSNLLGNAAKYSESNTRVDVGSMLDGAGNVTIFVKDNGRGMSADTTKSIFEKFYRARDVIKTHSGLGIGLFISSKIITDHGGRIWVESAEGTGSTFFFSLPLHQ